MPLMATVMVFCSALLVELCWLGAWAAFIWAGFVDRTFPLPEMLGAAVLAALFVRATAARRVRNLYMLALHGACMGAVWFFVLQRQPDYDLTLGVLLALTTAAFWTSGALHARRELSHRVVCARFDFGMYWLLALLGLRLLLRGQSDVPQQVELCDALVPSFFVNALCAICIARYRSQVSKQWLRVTGRIVMLFGGLGALGGFGFSLTWMLRPYLRSVAQTTHAGAAAVVRPLADAALKLVLAIMREGEKHPIPKYVPGRMPVPYPGRKDMPLEIAPVDEVALTTLGISVGVMALVAALVWLWLKRHWLLADQAAGAPASDLWALCRQLWRRALAWLRGLRTNAEAEPLRLMSALLIWGERSGVTRLNAETPLEYARRLKQTFAAMSGEIDRIVDNHSRQTYALGHCNEHELQQARRALRLLRSPRQWWARTVSRWRAMHARQRRLV